jgi:hypothetical protein
MLTKSKILFSLTALSLICGTQAVPVFAQGGAPTNWETNQQGAINRDVSQGALNVGQAAALQNREAQIQAQQQQYMNQNGGTLAPQQQRQIDSELRGVNQNINRDVRHDAAQNNPFGMQAAGQQWQNGFSNQGQFQRPQWPNNVAGQGQWQNPQWQAQQMGNPQQWQGQQMGNSQQGQSGQNGGHHHHHHDGNGFGGLGGNGSGAGGNGSGSFGGNGSGAGGNGSSSFGGNGSGAGGNGSSSFGGNGFGNNGFGNGTNTGGWHNQ